MKKELGKWLMDVAKYITTAVLIASAFNDVNDGWIVYTCATIAIALTMLCGLWLVRDKNDKDKKGD